MPRPAVRSLSLTSQESYSAVIIADMVAEVQTDDLVMGSHYHTRQDNPAFDEQPEMDSPAVVRVEAMETVDVGRRTHNGPTDISKGVILNATQFSLTPGSLKPAKPIEMGSVPEVRQCDVKATISADPSGFSDMSIYRKVAFGFSFLPSIMFVLCFAVILPCRDPAPPCVTEVWSKTLPNGTDVTSGLFVSGNVVYTSESDSYKISGLNRDNGDLVWNNTMLSTGKIIGCGHLVSSNSRACLVVETSGLFQMVNESDGVLLWSYEGKRMEEASALAPILLPACSGDGIEEVAFVYSKRLIKILFKRTISFAIEVSGCDSVPDKLTAWAMESQNGNETDLLFICRKGTEDMVIRIPQNKWCPYGLTDKKRDISTLDTRKRGALKRSSILPAADGLAVWTEDHVTMFDVSGQKRWEVISENHTSTNRFFIYGKVNQTAKRLLLFSSGLLPDGLMITYLSGDSGETVGMTTVPGAEITDVSLVEGENRDFALVYLRQVGTDRTSQALSHLDGMATTIVSTLAEEEILSSAARDISSQIQEEIQLLDLGNNLEKRTIYTVEAKYGMAEEPHEATLTVLTNNSKEKEELNIFVLWKPTAHSLRLQVQLKRINVANWNVENPQCSLKN